MKINQPQRSTARNRGFKFATAFVATFAVVFAASFTAHADAGWTGNAGDNQWDNTGNWDNTLGGNAWINSVNNYPIITANNTWIPNDVKVGASTGTTGRIDVRSGTLKAAYWTFIGDYNGSATLNIADTTTTGGTYTGFGLGSGSYDNRTLNDNGNFMIGLYQSTATVNMNTVGSLDVAQLRISPNAPSGSGTFNLDAGTVNVHYEMEVGSDYWGPTASLGVMNMSGGMVNVGGTLSIGRGNNTESTGDSRMTVAGGAVNVTGDVLIGFAGLAGTKANLTITNSGVFNVSSTAEKWVIMSQYDAINPTLNIVNGGILNLYGGTDIQFAIGGNSGTRVLNVDGGTLNGTAAGGSYINMQNSTSAGTSTINIKNGGLIAVDAIIGGAVSTLNFDNGTLKATADDAYYIGDGFTVNINAGGAILDTDGHNPTVVAGMAGAGGVTKTNSGTLTMTGASTYSGDTQIKGGTLALSGSGSINNSANIIVSSGATFDVSAVSFSLAAGKTLKGNGGIAGSVSAASGSTLSPGASAGTLTFLTNLTLSATSTNAFELSNTAGGSNDKILVGGTLAGNASKVYITATEGGPLDETTDYVLFYVTNGISSALATAPAFLGTPPANAANFSVISSGNTVVLHYAASTPPEAIGSATPASVVRNETATLAVVVTNSSTGISNVVVNLSSIGGSAAQAMTDTGTGTNFTYAAKVSAGTLAGITSLPVTVTDSNGLFTTFGIDLTVNTAAKVWDGGGADAKFSSDLNWASDFAPGYVGDGLTFAGSANTSPDMDAGYHVTGVSFNSGADSFTVGTTTSSTLTNGSGGIVNNSANPQTLNVPVVLGAAQTINAASGDLNLGGNVANSGNALTVVGASNTTLSGVVSGSGVLTKQGAGTLLLSGANTYTGMTLANGGTLNLTGTIPGPAQTIVGNADGTASMSISGSLTANEFVIGNNDGLSSPVATTGAVTMTSGTVTSTDWLIVGRQGGNGTFNQSGGTVAHSGGGRFVVGWHWQSGKEGTVGSYNLSGNAVLNANDTGESLSVGDSGGDTGSMAISDNATLTSAANIYVGNYGAGALTITNSADVNITGSLRVGEQSGASGTVTMAGGTVDMTGGLVLGRYSGNSSANVIISGGTMTVGGDSAIGHQGTGTLTITNTGTFVEPASKWLLLGAGGGSGTIHLDGGTLDVRHIETYGTGTVNLNGGTILVNSASDAIFDGDITTYVKAGGAVIDTAGYDKSVGSDLLEDAVSTGGGLTKNGAGTLLLNGANTYTGSTEVNAGTLGGTGSIFGPVNVNSGGTLAPGASIGTLTINNSLTFASGATANFEINKTGATLTGDKILGATSITADGTLNVSATSDALAAGDSFTLFNTGMGSSSFSSVSLPALDAGLSWDTNNLATTGVLDVYSFSTTTLPVATLKNTAANVSALKMAAQASSSKGTAVAVSASMPANGIASITAGALTYTPNTDYIGPDTFIVTFADGHGVQTMTVNVTVSAENTGPNITPVNAGGYGSFTASGLPNTAYMVQVTTSLSPANWTDHETVAAGDNGLISYTDTVTIAAHGGTVYYRLKQQ